MGGTESGTASNTYPAPWVAALGTFPPGGGASPLTVTTIPTVYANPIVGIAGYPTYGSFASNELADGSFYYTVPGSSGLINGSVTTHIDGHLVYYFLVQWSGGGTPTSSLPQTISLLLNTNLFASTQFNYGTSNLTSGLSASASASVRAFKETASSSGPTYVSGYHLVQASVSPLTATTGIAQTYLDGTVDQTASDPIPAGAYAAGHGYYPTNGPTQANADSEVTAGVRQDSRYVYVASNFPSPTYSKGPINTQHPTGQWANVRAADYSMADDTTVPGTSGTSAIYYPNYGGWGNNSTYNWQASLAPVGGQPSTASGTFNSTALFGNKTIPNFSGTYQNPPVTDGSADTILLSLKDGQDGAVGANTYTIRFHNPVANWIKLNTVRHPIALVQGTVNSSHPDWTYLMTIDNLGSQNLTQNMTGAVSVSVTETTTITGQQTLGAPSIAAFQANEGITNGKTYTYTYTTQSTFTGGPNTLTQFYTAMSYEDRSGTCDIYAANGFQGATTWFGRWSSGVASVGALQFPP